MTKKILSLLISFLLIIVVSCGVINEDPEDNTGKDDPVIDNPDNPPIIIIGGDDDGEEEEDVTYSTYNSYWMKQFDYKTMTIAGFNACPNMVMDYTKNFATKESLTLLKECGINTAYALYETLPGNSEDVQNILSACDELGLSYIVRLMAGSSKLAISSALTPFLGSKSLGGFFVSDEPGYRMFQSLKKSNDTVESIMPGLLYHMNLFPDYASEKQLYRSASDSSEKKEGGYTYEEYVDDYLEICNPQILSYDNYPFPTNFPSLRPNYFGNLVFIRDKAEEKGIPFWIYIQCYGDRWMRVPHEADILWQVNTGLTFGCKGIQYFCYYQPSYDFDGCLVDVNGQKTELWGYVKKANEQIAAVDEVLMCSKSMGVILVGSNLLDVPSSAVLRGYGSLSSVIGDHSYLGCFDYKGGEAYYVTNGSLTENENIQINFNRGSSGYLVVSGEKREFSDSVSIDLMPGDGALIVINK